MISIRLEQLRTALAQAGLDAVALNPGASFTYLTGLRFHLMERPVVLFIAPGRAPAIVLPELEKAKLDLLPYPYEAFPYGENPAEWDAAFRRALNSLELDGKQIGVEPRQMRLLEFGHVRAGAPEADFPDASEALASLRLRKDKAEVDAIRRAVGIAQRALETTLPSIRIGLTERQLAAVLHVHLLQNGSDSELPFLPIVSAGPNSANPHASPSDRPLQSGDLLVVDWGAAVEGHVSDLTRTFAVGDVDPELSKIAAIVLAANQAGIAAGRPGVACSNIDHAARSVIEKAGYGAYFTHRTGHGIGMEDHEEPYIRGDSKQMLYPGMAYTVEPGIYLTGRGGARIEDNLVVTKTGVDVLSDMPRELRRVG